MDLVLLANSYEDFNLKDYYSGGMVMPERNFSTINYRFGWNTQEKVDEISGVGNHNTAMFWEYDNRVNRRWNLDPKPVSWESQYAVNGNNPILFNDPNGDFKTKFGANLYAFFTGGTAFKEEGGEWGVEKKTVSFAADKSYKLNYSRSFGWRGRSVGKDLDFESAKEEWIVSYEQQQQIDQMERDGLWDKTLTPEEAQKNVLNIGGTVWLPNLIFRNVTSAANVVKTEQTVANGGLTINEGVLTRFTQHAFVKGRHADLGLSVETMASKGYNLVQQNLPKLAAGDNTIHVTINGIQKTIMANVKDGAVRSINMYHGISERVTQGTVINLGKVTW